MKKETLNIPKSRAFKKVDGATSADFSIGESVIYEDYICVVQKKQGQKCLGIPMPMGWSYFIPNWSDVKRA